MDSNANSLVFIWVPRETLGKPTGMSRTHRRARERERPLVAFERARAVRVGVGNSYAGGLVVGRLHHEGIAELTGSCRLTFYPGEHLLNARKFLSGLFHKRRGIRKETGFGRLLDFIAQGGEAASAEVDGASLES